MMLQLSAPVRDVLVATLRRQAVRVRLSLEDGVGPFDFVGRLEGDAGALDGWRLYAFVDGAPLDDEGVEIMLGLDRFDDAHVEQDAAVFVAGDNRLEICPVLA